MRRLPRSDPTYLEKNGGSCAFSRDDAVQSHIYLSIFESVYSPPGASRLQDRPCLVVKSNKAVSSSGIPSDVSSCQLGIHDNLVAKQTAQFHLVCYVSGSKPAVVSGSGKYVPGAPMFSLLCSFCKRADSLTYSCSSLRTRNRTLRHSEGG